jgi:hypothetical protein
MTTHTPSAAPVATRAPLNLSLALTAPGPLASARRPQSAPSAARTPDPALTLGQTAATSPSPACRPERTITPPAPRIIHPRLLTDLNRRLDRAMRKHDRQAIPALLIIADWLASLDATLPTRNAQARARAAARYLGGRHA